MESVKGWVAANYAEAMASMQHSLRVAYVVFSFCAAFFLGGIKGTPFLVISRVLPCSDFGALLCLRGSAPGRVFLFLLPPPQWMCSDGGRTRCRRADDSGQRRRHTRALPGARLVDNLLAHQVSRPATSPCVLALIIYSTPFQQNPILLVDNEFDLLAPLFLSKIPSVANCIFSRPIDGHTV
jgi:hypothetical protein